MRKSDLKTDPDCPKPPKARKENVRNVQPATGHPTAYHPQSMTSGPESNPSPQVIDYYDGILPPASTRGRSIPPITSRQQHCSSSRAAAERISDTPETPRRRDAAPTNTPPPPGSRCDRPESRDLLHLASAAVIFFASDRESAKPNPPRAC